MLIIKQIKRGNIFILDNYNSLEETIIITIVVIISTVHDMAKYLSAIWCEPPHRLP